MLEKKNYPITLLKELEELLKYFYSIEYRYSDLISITFTNPHIVEIKDNDNSGFRFVVSRPNQVDKKGFCQITKKPKSRSSLEELSSTSLISDIKILFEEWISILIQYNEIELTKEDFFAKEEERL